MEIQRMKKLFNDFEPVIIKITIHNKHEYNKILESLETINNSLKYQFDNTMFTLFSCIINEMKK